jgi:hypothetical protein
MTTRRFRWRVLLLLGGLALVASACTGASSGPGSGASQAASAQVRQLTSIATLREAFNADAGATRLILLVSPT